MHLIAPLAAGVAGAGSGTAFLYQRGTSTLLSTYYTDFEATAAVSQASTGIALDSNGGAVVYVDTLCTVVVKSSLGSTIRTFVAGVKDSAVEVISDSFTGTDYASAATGVSKPTTLQAVLDRWNNSAGTSNFQVLVGGVATNLQTAVQGVSGFFYNVKASPYGAVGDGTTDDTASVQAAIDAADTAGGGVVLFPPGTYRYTSQLSVSYKVSLQGCGPSVTHLKLDNASNAIGITFPGTTSDQFRSQFVRDLRLSSAQANTNGAINIQDAFLEVSNVEIVGSASGHTNELVNIGASAAVTAMYLLMNGCVLTTGGSSAPFLVGNDPTTGRQEFNFCKFITTATNGSATITSGGGAGTLVKAIGCEVDLSSVTTVGAQGVFGSTSDLIVHGCYCKAPASGSGFLINAGVVAASGGICRESGNVVDGAGVTLYQAAMAATRFDQVFLDSRVNQWRDTSTTAASAALDAVNYSAEMVQKTSGATLTVNCNQADSCPVGHPYTLTVWNDNTGGALAVTFGTGFKGTNDNIANNTMRTYQFISRIGPSGNIRLYQIGTPRDETE